MAKMKDKIGNNHFSKCLKDYLRQFGAQNIELTKEERVTVIHALHNLEDSYKAAVKQKLLEHRNAISHILTTGLGEEMNGYLIDR